MSGEEKKICTTENTETTEKRREVNGKMERGRISNIEQGISNVQGKKGEEGRRVGWAVRA
jgi:hypothetical protein